MPSNNAALNERQSCTVEKNVSTLYHHIQIIFIRKSLAGLALGQTRRVSGNTKRWPSLCLLSGFDHVVPTPNVFSSFASLADPVATKLKCDVVLKLLLVHLLVDFCCPEYECCGARVEVN